MFFKNLLIFFLLFACTLASVANSDTSTVISLTKKAWEIKASNPDSAKILLDASMEISKKLGFQFGEAEVLRMRAVLAHIQGDMETAFELAQQAFEIYAKHNKHQGKVSSLSTMGHVYYSKGKYLEALTTYIEVLKLHELANDSLGMANVYNNIGNACFQQKDNPKALKYYTLSNKLFKKFDNIAGQASATTNIAHVLTEQKLYKEALENYDIAERLVLQTGNKLVLSGIYHNKATCFRYQNQLAQAKTYYEKAYALKLELNNVEGICSSLIGLAFVAQQTGEPGKAIKLGKQALETALKAGFLVWANQAYEVIYQSYANLNDFNNAFEYYKHFSVTKDSLINLEKTKQIEEVQAKYEAEKKEQRILLLTKESEMQAAIKNRAIAMSVLLSFVLILGAYGFRLKAQNARIKNEKLTAENHLKEEENLRLAEELKAETEYKRLQAEKHQLELDFKNREMTSVALFLAQRNAILSELKEKMTGLTEDKPMLGHLKPLLRTIDNNLALVNDWENFKLHFDQVHPDFFERLKSQYPALTQAELKHIAYMKINLDTKEIARLLNISPKGIQMGRYRLKKKLALTEDTNLMEFINKY